MAQQDESLTEQTNFNEIDLTQPEIFPSVPFAELPLDIPNMTQNVVGYDGGINKAALNVESNKDLLCILQPYWNMAEGDFILLFCKSTVTPVASHTLTAYEAENGLKIPLYIPYLRLSEGEVSPLFFQVQHVNGDIEETRHFKLKIDTLEPGGRDPIASTPQNENLSKPIFDKEIIENGVSEADAGRGVKVLINPYPTDTSLPAGHHMATRDRIRLRIGPVIVEHVVTEGEASSKAAIQITIYAGTWAEIGSGDHICEYEVIDEVGNYSQGWSAMQFISVYLKDSTQLLPKPFIEEANIEDEVDLDQLNGSDATIIVYVRDLDYLIGDLILIEAEGRTEDYVIIKTNYQYEVTSLARHARVTLPFEDLRRLVKGSMRLHYKRYRNGISPNRRSKVAVYNIIGAGNSKGLPPPTVLEAPDGNLKADVATVTVRIEPFPGQTSFAGITVKLVGTRANGAAYYREIDQRPAGTGPITIRIANGANGEINKLLDGGTLYISYSVTPEDPGPVRESEAVYLEVGDIAPSLPAPLVEEAPPPDFVYNPEVSKYGATIVIYRNAAFTLNSEVTLYFEGSAAGGSKTFKPFKITQNWLHKDLYFFVEPSTVDKNINGSARAQYALTKEDQRTRFSHATTIKVGAPLNLPEPEVLESTVISPGKATINPAHVLSPAFFTIRARYSPMLDTQQINMRMEGTIGPGTPFIPSQSGNSAQGFVDFIVSNKAIAANLGEKKCRIIYEVVSAHTTTLSKELILEVQPLPSSLLDVVSIPEAVEGVIDANLYNSVLTLKYPFMAKDQAYFINLIGENDLLLNDKVTLAEVNAQKIVKEIPADYLSSLPNGSPVTVRVSVSLNGINDINSAIPLGVPPPYKIKKAVGIINHIDVGGTPSWLVASPDGKYVYVTNNTTHSVSVIDTRVDRVVHTITGLNSPYSIAIHPDGSLLYVGNLGDRTVSIFSTADYKELPPRIPGFGAPHGIAINDRATRMYVTCNADGYIYVHDVASRGRLASIKILYPTGIALNPSNSRLYIADYSRVSILDTSSNLLVGTGIAGFNYPRSMAYSPHNTATPRIYVTNQNSNNVIIINAGTNIIHSTLTGFLQPFGVAINPLIEHAYITENTGNSLKIIDTKTEQVIDTFTGLNQPRGVTVLPNGSKFYVANAGGHSVTVFAT